MSMSCLRVPVLGRVAVLVLLLLFVVGCIHTRDPWAEYDMAEARQLAAADPGRICQVRIESAFDGPVELAYRAGSHALSLGIMEPDEGIQVGVPCDAEEIQVYRVRPRRGAVRDIWIPRSRDRLDPLQTIRVVVRPSAAPRG